MLALKSFFGTCVDALTSASKNLKKTEEIYGDNFLSGVAMFFKCLILRIKGIPAVVAFLVRMTMWATVGIIGLAACMLVVGLAAIPMIAGFILIVYVIYAVIITAIASIARMFTLLSAIRAFALTTPLVAGMILLCLLGLYSMYLLIKNKRFQDFIGTVMLFGAAYVFRSMAYDALDPTQLLNLWATYIMFVCAMLGLLCAYLVLRSKRVRDAIGAAIFFMAALMIQQQVYDAIDPSFLIGIWMHYIGFIALAGLTILSIATLSKLADNVYGWTKRLRWRTNGLKKGWGVLLPVFASLGLLLFPLTAETPWKKMAMAAAASPAFEVPAATVKAKEDCHVEAWDITSIWQGLKDLEESGDIPELGFEGRISVSADIISNSEAPAEIRYFNGSQPISMTECTGVEIWFRYKETGDQLWALIKPETTLVVYPNNLERSYITTKK